MTARSFVDARVDIIVAVIVAGVVSSGCAFADDPPAARYACRVDAPTCPKGELCIVAGDDDEGLCGPRSLCTASDDDDGKKDGVARPAADGVACSAPDGSATPHACAGGRCVELTCDTPGRGTVCGDGCRDDSERCDDGNARDGDGCSSACVTEPGWECSGAPSTCATRCGDGVTSGDEVCDDGNGNPVDGCSERCTRTQFASAPLVAGSVDGVSAATMPFDLPLGITADADGVLYVADSRHHRIVRVDPRIAAAGANADGAIADAIVVAGNGTAGFSGDGGPALQAELCLPVGVAVDAFGNLFVADTLNHRVRRIDRDGTITTIAGSTEPGAECSFATGGADDDTEKNASAARFDRPLGVAVDPRGGAVYVIDTGNLRVRRLQAQGPRESPTSWRVRTVAGVARADSAPPPVVVDLSDGSDLGADLGPTGLAVTPDGGLVVADTLKFRTVSLSPACLVDGASGCRVTTNSLGLLSLPFSVHALDDGSIATTDLLSNNVFVRGLIALGPRSTIHRGDTTAPALGAPSGVTSIGDDLYVVDADENRVLRRRPDGAIDVVAGLPGIHIVDGQPANEAELLSPAQVALDGDGGVHVVEPLRHVARRFAAGADGVAVSERTAGVARLDMFAALVNNGSSFGAAFGQFIPQSPGRAARPGPGACVAGKRDVLTLGGSDSGGPEGIAVFERADGHRSVFIADTFAQQVLRFDDDGTICDVVSGSVVDGEGFDSVFQPAFLHVVGHTLLVVDQAFGFASRLVRVEFDAEGAPIGGPQTLTLFSRDVDGTSTTGVESVADVLPLDDGSLLVADPRSSVVWRLASVGSAPTPYVGQQFVAGDSAADVSRANARLFSPLGLARCPDGRVVIADGGAVDRDDAGVRLRAISADGTRVTTLAGTGQRGFSGDFGAATSARLTLTRPVVRGGVFLAPPVGVACGVDGSVYVADREAQRVRRLGPDGVITTIVGRSAPLGPGPIGQARLYAPPTFATGLPGVALPSLVVVDGGVGLDGTNIDGAGRVVVVDGGAAARMDIALGYPHAATSTPGPAALASLLLGARGVAWDTARARLVVTQSASASVRVVDVADDDPAHWRELPPVDVGEPGLAGLAVDPLDGSFVVADEDDDCVRRLSPELAIVDDVVGTCAASGSALLAPSHVAFAATGTLYVADTGHHRVLRVDGRGPAAGFSVVVGEAGEAASAGEGAPAAAQAVNTPRQMAFDAHDNLYVTSTTTVRVLINDDGDDPDGDDHVVTAFGAGAGVYPEHDASCLTAVAPLPAGLSAPDGAEDAVVVGDACLGAAALVFVRSAP